MAFGGSKLVSRFCLTWILPMSEMVNVRISIRVVSFVAALVALGALIALPASASSASSSRPHVALGALESGVLAQLNEIRVAHGLVPLQLDPTLTAAARAHTHEMLSDGYFEHNSADGSAFWKRIEQFYPPKNGGSWSVGENLIWTAGTMDAKQALATWMASHGHRANILYPNWRQIGVAAAYTPDAPGVFGGHPALIVTTDFGVR
jgi:uncharacterized protein YkwD